MPLVAAVALPSDLDAAGRQQALGSLPRARTAILVVADVDLNVHHARSIAGSSVPLVTDEPLLRAIADHCHAPRVQQQALDRDLGQLAEAVLTSGQASAVVPVSIGAATADAMLSATAAAFVSLLAELDGAVLVVADRHPATLTMLDHLAAIAHLSLQAPLDDDVALWRLDHDT